MTGWPSTCTSWGVPEAGPDDGGYPEPPDLQHLYASENTLESLVFEHAVAGGYKVFPITDTTDLTVHYKED